MPKLDREQPTGKECIKMLLLVLTQIRYLTADRIALIKIIKEIYVASFTTKIVADIDITDEWDPWTFGFGTRASIKLERDVDGQTEIEWVNCGNVCTVPDGEWIKHTGNCYLPSIENVANAYFTLSGLDSQHEMFISDASFQPFIRNR